MCSQSFSPLIGRPSRRPSISFSHHQAGTARPTSHSFWPGPISTWADNAHQLEVANHQSPENPRWSFSASWFAVQGADGGGAGVSCPRLVEDSRSSLDRLQYETPVHVVNHSAACRVVPVVDGEDGRTGPCRCCPSRRKRYMADWLRRRTSGRQKNPVSVSNPAVVSSYITLYSVSFGCARHTSRR